VLLWKPKKNVRRVLRLVWEVHEARGWRWPFLVGMTTVFIVIGHRLGRQTRRVRYENEREGPKVAPCSPPTRNKGLGAVLSNPATVAVLTAVGVVLSLFIMLLTAWLVVLGTVQKPKATRPVHLWA
jgi:hypothetical protein